MLATDFSHTRLCGVGNIRQPSVDRIDHRALTNEMFDPTIFEGMKTDHRHATTGREHVERRFEATLQLTKFVVDMHTQRLKGTRSRMFAVVGTHDSLHQIGKLARTAQRRLRASRHDRARDAPGMSLFTKFSDHSKQLPLVGASDEVGCRLAAGGIHAHIERTVFGKTEAAGRIVNLRRGHTEIE